MVEFDKEKNTGKKKKKATEKRKRPLNKKKDRIPSQEKGPSRAPAIDPLSNSYVLTLLKYCHRNFAKCYGCSGEFYINGYSQGPQDLIIVSKTKGMFARPQTKK